MSDKQVLQDNIKTFKEVEQEKLKRLKDGVKQSQESRQKQMGQPNQSG